MQRRTRRNGALVIGQIAGSPIGKTQYAVGLGRISTRTDTGIGETKGEQMSLPKPQTDEQLDAADWLDIKRTEITLRARIWARRQKNLVAQEALDALAAGRILKPELTAGGDDPSVQ